MIGVKNKGAEILKGPNVKFNGEPFVFEPGQTKVISEDAARHIFGFGGTEDDRHRVVTRLGWAMKGEDMEAALQRLDQFVFLQAEMKVADEEKTNTLSLPRSVTGEMKNPLKSPEVPRTVVNK